MDLRFYSCRHLKEKENKKLEISKYPQALIFQIFLY